MLIDLVARSYEKFAGKPFSKGPLDEQWLYWTAPFGLLVHNTDPDPLFVYANKTAQHCFEYTWSEFTELPSRLSAETELQSARQTLLAKVAADNFVTGYRGVRIAKSGRRFWIEDATIWNVVDDNGDHAGQAALFPHWSPLTQP
ncbi:MEKHLA domain-containing protein [Actinocrispum sp. NPDC049592]|uniref:MEKHLA domain-containing protein n=1 Tax=Actinocrispum sp. NPDC049592 TaxID=3154835 RepID=UPI003444D62F